MLTSIENNVDVELFIERERSNLYKKIISQHNLNELADSSNTLKLVSPIKISARNDKRIEITSLYRIRNSFLKNQELVFQVEYLSSKYFYCAFEFKGYMVCPAFLAAALGLTKYACLNVINGSGTGYCYIFVKLGPNDNILKILANFDIPKECEFILPSESNRGVVLHSRNKDIRNILEYDELEKSNPIRKEWITLAVSSHVLPQISATNPSYQFLPKNIIDDFATRHQEFFNKDDFSFGYTSFFHENSQSYLEIIDLISKPDFAKQELELVTQSLSDIFINTEYEREGYILRKLVNHIQRNYRKANRKIEKVLLFDYCDSSKFWIWEV